MAYINEDKSFTITSSLSENNTNGKLMLDMCRKIHKKINPMILGMGYTRIDERGDRNDVTPPTGGSRQYREYIFNNVYKKSGNNDNIFLICSIGVYCGSSSSNSWDSTPFSSNHTYTTRIYFSLSKTNVSSDVIATPDDLSNTGLNYTYINNILIASDAFRITATNNQASVIIPMRMVTINTITGTTPISLSKFVICNNNPYSTPHVGFVQINDKPYNCISTLNNYLYVDRGGGTLWPGGWDVRYPNPEASLSNLFVPMDEEYGFGLSNFLSNYSFRNTLQKFPLVPVYVTSTNSSSSSNYTYDYNKKITGLYQTSADYANSIGTRYTLNNINYYSLGNHFLLKEE
jgi:hypothetical protein